MENEQQKPMSIFFGDEKGPGLEPSKMVDQSEPKTLQTQTLSEKTKEIVLNPATLSPKNKPMSVTLRNMMLRLDCRFH